MTSGSVSVRIKACSQLFLILAILWGWVVFIPSSVSEIARSEESSLLLSSIILGTNRGKSVILDVGALGAFMFAAVLKDVELPSHWA